MDVQEGWPEDPPPSEIRGKDPDWRSKKSSRSVAKSRLVR